MYYDDYWWWEVLRFLGWLRLVSWIIQLRRPNLDIVKHSQTQLSRLIEGHDPVMMDPQEVRDWSATLSAGERQRLAFARLFMMLVSGMIKDGEDVVEKWKS